MVIGPVDTEFSQIILALFKQDRNALETYAHHPEPAVRLAALAAADAISGAWVVVRDPSGTPVALRPRTIPDCQQLGPDKTGRNWTLKGAIEELRTRLLQ